MTWKNTIRKSGITKGEIKLNPRRHNVMINFESIGKYDLMEEEFIVTVDFEVKSFGMGFSIILNKVNLEGMAEFFYDSGEEQEGKETGLIDITFDKASKLELNLDMMYSKGNELNVEFDVSRIEISLFFNEDMTVNESKSSVDEIEFTQA